MSCPRPVRVIHYSECCRGASSSRSSLNQGKTGFLRYRTLVYDDSETQRDADVLLTVEDGVVILIRATTREPFFEVNQLSSVGPRSTS